MISIIVGELLLVLLTTIAQEVIVHGVHLKYSPTQDIIIGGSATLIAGVISGFVAAVIVGRAIKIPHIFISILIGVETVYLICTSRVCGILWFDIQYANLLIGSVWVGYYLLLKVKRQ